MSKVALQSNSPLKGTRWRRAVPMMVVGVGAVWAMTSAIQQNVLAASLVMQNGTFQFSTSQITGTDTAFGIATANQQDGSNAKTLRTSMRTAQLNGFCLSKQQSFAGLGTVTFRLTTGDGNASTSEFTAQNVSFDVDNFTASGNGMVLGGNVQMGISAMDVQTTGTDNPLDVAEPAGAWAINSPQSSIYGMRGELRSATLPIAAIPGLHITAKINGAQCNDAGQALPQ
jgi:hypothetical protein